MKLRSLGEGRLRVHMDDADDYECTDDNGVDIDLSPAQVGRIVRWVVMRAPGYVMKILEGKNHVRH